jgi:hypothetical protein
MAKRKQQNGATPVSLVTVAQRLAVLEQQLVSQRQAKEQHQQLAQAAEIAIQRLIGAISVLREVDADQNNIGVIEAAAGGAG